MRATAAQIRKTIDDLQGRGITAELVDTKTMPWPACRP